ncbi:MAG: helix-turn-helix transcriptional regulator [Magnetococcales bacterium]|nr:helix-turn-helix transcriptional regulator [Magnetococcales bacterium]MBF0181965.1 helix-turn-helix transcriptional regulator [Magnetococcales bacterium]
MGEDDVLFGKRLKQARDRAGISQRQLGFRIGLEPSGASPRINRYERGTRAPAFAIVKEIAAELNVSPSFFYEPDDTLAVILLYLGAMDDAGKVRLLEQLKKSIPNDPSIHS